VAARPLRVGLSVLATVDTEDSSGTPLGMAPAEPHLSATQVFDGQREHADQRIAEIISAHRGPPGSATSKP
jgi:hypothetical protein